MWDSRVKRLRHRRTANRTSSGDAAVLGALERIERKLDVALRPTPALLSKRAAAKMLGIDRGTTLETLLRDGHLRLVMGKIPLANLERLLAEGLAAPRPRKRRQRPEERHLTDEEEAEAFRRIKV
jgi:hypothetical protein